MKYLLSILVASSILLSCDDSDVLTEKEAPVIRYGTSFGFCIGFCNEDLEVSANQVYFVKYTNDNSETPVSKTIAFNAESYDQLLLTVEEEKFLALEPVIGCPDCADGGAEWVEIKIGNQTKKVTFEYGRDIEGISQLVAELRMIRNQIKD